MVANLHHLTTFGGEMGEKVKISANSKLFQGVTQTRGVVLFEVHEKIAAELSHFQNRSSRLLYVHAYAHTPLTLTKRMVVGTVVQD